MPTLKPMTPLQPLMQASMKPPTPLQPKNARNTASFRPQRRCGFNPTRVRASKGDAGFRQAGRLVYRTQMRYPWPAAGPGRATSGRPTLQTSSNQHDSNRLARTSVTNVVNLSPKTTIISEKAIELTTFVTPGQKSTQKTPWIDDVCNNTRRATRQHTTPHWYGGRRRDLPRCPWAVAGPVRASSRRTQPHASDTAPPVWRAPEGTRGPGCGARGRWRGLAGLRDEAPNSDQAPLVWRAPEGPEGTGGLRGAAPNEVRTPSLAGGRALRRPEHPWGHKHQPKS